MNKLVRIPETSDYRAAIELENETVQAEGGAWVRAMRIEQATRQNGTLFKRSKVASNIAKIVEPLDDSNVAFDKKYGATRAFKHGVLEGFNIVEVVHNDLMDYDGIVSGLIRLLTHELGERSKLEQWAEMLVLFGDQGIGRIDDDSQARIEEWANEYDRDLHFQRLYKLGVGATIHSGYHIHKGFIEKQVVTETQFIDWSELLPPYTGE